MKSRTVSVKSQTIKYEGKIEWEIDGLTLKSLICRSAKKPLIVKKFRFGKKIYKFILSIECDSDKPSLYFKNCTDEIVAVSFKLISDGQLIVKFRECTLMGQT